jgi:hypothetical protein
LDAFLSNQKPDPPLVIPVPAGLKWVYRKYSSTYQSSVPISPHSIRLIPSSAGKTGR